MGQIYSSVELILVDLKRNRNGHQYGKRKRHYSASDMDLFDSPEDHRQRQRNLSLEIALQENTRSEKSAKPKKRHERTKNKGLPTRKRLSTSFYGSTRSKKSSHGPGHPSRLQPLIYSSSSDSEKEEGK